MLSIIILTLWNMPKWYFKMLMKWSKNILLYFVNSNPAKLSGWVGLSKEILVGLVCVPKHQRKIEKNLLRDTTGNLQWIASGESFSSCRKIIFCQQEIMILCQLLIDKHPNASIYVKKYYCQNTENWLFLTKYDSPFS